MSIEITHLSNQEENQSSYFSSYEIQKIAWENFFPHVIVQNFDMHCHLALQRTYTNIHTAVIEIHDQLNT